VDTLHRVPPAWRTKKVCSAWMAVRTRKMIVLARRRVVPMAAAPELVASLIPTTPNPTPTRRTNRNNRRLRMSLSGR
jgi:hypothetical protein